MLNIKQTHKHTHSCIIHVNHESYHEQFTRSILEFVKKWEHPKQHITLLHCAKHGLSVCTSQLLVHSFNVALDFNLINKIKKIIELSELCYTYPVNGYGQLVSVLSATTIVIYTGWAKYNNKYYPFCNSIVSLFYDFL